MSLRDPSVAWAAGEHTVHQAKKDGRSMFGRKIELIFRHVEL